MPNGRHNEEQFEAEFLRNAWILNEENKVVHPDSMLEWVRFSVSDRRRVALDHVGSSIVSTVFLGIAHNNTVVAHPHLFETAVFKRGRDVWIPERYSTWNQAVEGHRRVLVHVTHMLAHPRENPDDEKT